MPLFQTSQSNIDVNSSVGGSAQPAHRRNQNPIKQGNVATKSNNPGGTIGGECYDYRCGFCINGPHCKYKHVRRSPEDIETLRLPQWYFKKIKSVFT